MEDKIKLTKKQIEVLDRLNFKLFHEFWPQPIDLNKEKHVREFNKESVDFKLGYAHAVWDILFITGTASQGYLPTNNTIKEWANKSGEKFKEFYNNFGILVDWQEYRYKKDEKKVEQKAV